MTAFSRHFLRVEFPLLTVALEFAPLSAVLLGAPDVGRLLASSSPFNLFVKETGGPWLNVAISLGIALAMLNALTTPRICIARLRL
jgi:hypothetical protein